MTLQLRFHQTNVFRVIKDVQPSRGCVIIHNKNKHLTSLVASLFCLISVRSSESGQRTLPVIKGKVAFYIFEEENRQDRDIDYKIIQPQAHITKKLGCNTQFATQIFKFCNFFQ